MPASSTRPPAENPIKRPLGAAYLEGGLTSGRSGDLREAWQQVYTQVQMIEP